MFAVLAHTSACLRATKTRQQPREFGAQRRLLNAPVAPLLSGAQILACCCVCARAFVAAAAAAAAAARPLARLTPHYPNHCHKHTPTHRNRYVEAEKTNGRWAMAAVAGILGTELLGVEPKWFEAGAKDYGIPIAPLVAVQFLVMGFLETKRFQGWKETGTVRAVACVCVCACVWAAVVCVVCACARAHPPPPKTQTTTNTTNSRALSTASPLTRRA